MSERERSWAVSEAEAGERLDAHVGARAGGLSRSRAAALIEAGEVTVNGRLAKKSSSVSAGDVVRVRVPEPEASSVEAEDIPLRIVYEDEDVAVIDKPAGLVVHPAPGHRSGTLVNALLHHIDDLSGIGGVRRPGLVHRLDKDTSGLLLVAKHDEAHRKLSDALKRREIRRSYLAAAWGHLEQERMSVDAPIGRSRTDRKRMAIGEGGRRALTHFRRLERWLAADLLEARLETGRTHQIRVHLLSIGHPIVGDRVYGGGAARGVSGPHRAWASELERRTPRQFLHAWRLGFVHPRSGEKMDFRSPLPEDLEAVRAWASA
ncbi:MAG TPA: RluA family pseudouridine synthase [Longimicrobiales bacterium]|nr:RluA family pseudouridine synthase [Longimicrobiales bacterium]